MTTATVTPIRARKRKADDTGPLPPMPDDAYPPDAVPVPTDRAPFAYLPVDQIDPDPNNRPCVLDDELVDSVRQLGVLQPILVRATDAADRFQIVAGERRWRATIAAGRNTIPAVVADMTDAEAAVIQAVENLRRRDLAPTEECRAVVRCTTLGLTVDDIAARLGVTPSWVKQRVAALTLPPHFLIELDAHHLGWDDIASAAALPPDIVTKLSPTRHAIGDAVALERRRKEANKRIRQLEKKGAVIVGAGVGVAVHEAVGWAVADEHQKEPCHAIRVTPQRWGVDERPVCTDPKRHDPTGPSALKRPSRQQSGTSSTTERYKARVASLVEWGRPFLARYKPEPADVEMLMAELIDRHGYLGDPEYSTALRILDIKPGKLSVSDKTKTLVDYATTRSTNTWVALLLWISAGISEYRTNPTAHKWCVDHGWIDPHPPTPNEHLDDDDQADDDEGQGDDELDEYGEQLSIDDADG